VTYLQHSNAQHLSHSTMERNDSNALLDLHIPLTQPSFLPPPYLLLHRSILDDVRWLLGDSVHPQSPSDPQTLDPWFGPVRHASDYFHTIHEAAVYLIKNGLAYVDDLTPGRWEVTFPVY
jgi:hypothetical protein